MNTRTQEAGFTLVETLVAVFALALLMSAGGLLLISTLNTAQTVESRLQQLGKLEIATAYLRADLANSVPRLSRSVRPNENGKGFYGGLPDRDDVVLGLLRTGRSNIDNLAERSQLLAVSYRYVDGQLIRRIDENPDRARRTPRYETVLIDGLQDLEVLFDDESVQSTGWEQLVEEGVQILPDGVTVIMTFQTGERLVQSFLVGTVA